MCVRPVNLYRAKPIPASPSLHSLSSPSGLRTPFPMLFYVPVASEDEEEKQEEDEKEEEDGEGKRGGGRHYRGPARPISGHRGHLVAKWSDPTLKIAVGPKRTP